jgi:radical SAM-linked protein
LQAGPGVKVRVQYSKAGKARYLSHLELMTAMMRAMRRADFPLRYSTGFHPSPRVSFGPALGVGIAGLKEYLDLELTPPFDRESALRALNDTLPAGISVAKLVPFYGRERSLNSFIVRYIYEIRSGTNLDSRGFSERNEVVVERKGERLDIGKMVEDVSRLDGKTFRLTLRDLGEIKVRLTELIPAIFGVAPEEVNITRTGMFGWNGEWVEPLEDEKRIWAARS